MDVSSREVHRPLPWRRGACRSAVLGLQMSFTITRLLERYNRLGAATLQDRPEQFFDGAPTPAIGLWRLWAHAESFLRLKDWSRALNWLDTSEAIIDTRNIEVGQVWLADFA